MKKIITILVLLSLSFSVPAEAKILYNKNGAVVYAFTRDLATFAAESSEVFGKGFKCTQLFTSSVCLVAYFTK